MDGKPDQAWTRDCDGALSLNRNDPRALDSRAYVYFQLGRYDKAIRDLDDALELNPSLPTAYYVRGMAKLKLGDAANVSSRSQLVREKFG